MKPANVFDWAMQMNLFNSSSDMSPDKPEERLFSAEFAEFAEKKYAYLCDLSGLCGECPKLNLNPSSQPLTSTCLASNSRGNRRGLWN